MSKTVLITGASSGFGRDAAETLAHAGHRVFASMRDTADRNRPHAAALRARGIHVVELDVTDDASVERGVAEVFADTERLDVLVNNAGIGSAGVSEAFVTDQMRALFDVNVFGVQRMLRAVLPAFRRQGEGLVVNIGSILGRVTFPFLGLYGASKFAVEALTDSYRYELSQLGVDVVLVQPSAYPTNMYAAAQKPATGELAKSYGETAEVPGKILKTFMTLFQGENAPNPQDVATAIDKIVATPAGSRPDRVVVGLPFGSDAINTAVAPIQRGVIESLGLGDLTKLSIS